MEKFISETTEMLSDMENVSFQIRMSSTNKLSELSIKTLLLTRFDESVLKYRLLSRYSSSRFCKSLIFESGNIKLIPFD